MKTVKNIYCIIYLTGLIVLSFGCNSNDPVKEAKEENKDKIDSIKDQSKMDSAAASLLPSKDDADFLVNAASGGMMEVQLGHIAEMNSKNKRVKDFAAMMIKDHGAGGEKLKALAASKNITLSDSISNKQQKEIERLRKLKGAAFDENYISMMVDDHKNDIKEFEKAATNGNNPAIKSFASDNLKTLHTHLDSAVSIMKQVSPDKSMPDPALPVN